MRERRVERELSTDPRPWHRTRLMNGGFISTVQHTAAPVASARSSQTLSGYGPSLITVPSLHFGMLAGTTPVHRVEQSGATAPTQTFGWPILSQPSPKSGTRSSPTINPIAKPSITSEPPPMSQAVPRERPCRLNYEDLPIDQSFFTFVFIDGPPSL